MVLFATCKQAMKSLSEPFYATTIPMPNVNGHPGSDPHIDTRWVSSARSSGNHRKTVTQNQSHPDLFAQ
jgi:hypothetical protein